MIVKNRFAEVHCIYMVKNDSACKVSLWDDENYLKLDYDSGYTILYIL